MKTGSPANSTFTISNAPTGKNRKPESARNRIFIFFPNQKNSLGQSSLRLKSEAPTQRHPGGSAILESFGKPQQSLRTERKRMDRLGGARLRTVDQDAVSFDFLKTELETGITFADLALSAKYADKLERNKANARKAYDTALKFIDKLKPEDASDLDTLFKHLRSKLRELGESI